MYVLGNKKGWSCRSKYRRRKQ